MGVSWQEFQDTPIIYIEKLKEYRQAKAEGESNAARREKMKQKLKGITK